MNNELSNEEFNNLNKELNNLKKIKIPKIIEEIKNSKLFGDLSENSEYYYAKKKKNLLEKKIKDIEYILSNSKISNEKNKNLIIKLKNIKSNQIIEYNIKKDNKCQIYNELKNKNINDLIKIKKYNKEIMFEIISIN